MEIRFKLSKSDYNTFIKSQLLKYFSDHIYYLIIVPIILALFIWPKPVTLEFVLIWFSLTAAINCFYIVYPYLRFRKTVNKILSEGGNLYGDQIVQLAENGLNLGATEIKNEHNWESIKSVIVNNNYIYIIFHAERFVIIPQNAFQNDSEISSFLGIINSKRKTQSPINFSNKQIKKPPYYIGLFCLVPLVGIFVALYLILTGVFKYKNNWIIIIGLFGLIISLLIVYYIKKDQINQFKYERYQKGLIQYSQGQLNNLVKNIEFYKLVHGSYPKDLSQLKKYDESSIIQDDISKLRTLFNYRKIGDRYSLSSNGFDGIPYTTDDIFPSITIGDSTNIGLIRE